jgi:transaldolase/glucose-6-phosphate isomerase
MAAHATKAVRTEMTEPGNPLRDLASLGQSVWLDYLRRSVTEGGELKRLIEEDGITGVTSNPAIFEKAMVGSTDYDQVFSAFESRADADVAAIYDHLAIGDIRAAADLLRPIFDATGGRDGFVSLEVSPYLAMDTEATIAEARRLWQAVGRDNLMIKVPGTEAGVPAIRSLITEGISVNVTLLFSRRAYEAVANAYLDGLEALLGRGDDISRVASVASFFVSRIDTAIDHVIDERIAAGDPVAEELRALRGKVAIANAKLAYDDFLALVGSRRWKKLAAAGARTQRLLWASTGTKDPAYSDVLYVEELIGPDTVNTMPPATMDAFRDHGRSRVSLTENVEAARQIIAAADRLGTDLDGITEKLANDGVRLFSEAADKLFGAIARKRVDFLGRRINRLAHNLPPELDLQVSHNLERARTTGLVRRLWARDASLWSGADEAKWLAWLGIADEQEVQVQPLLDFQAEVKAEGFSHVLLLGMGGSSLGPEVLADTFGRQAGYPELFVLDSTDPAQIASADAKVDLATTLFIVSSKSGSTLEPNILEAYFFDRVCGVLGPDRAGSRFIAITDPGSSLERLAREKRFGRIFFGDPGIGGRYSVLSNFGMVPAAAIGIDLRRFLEATEVMVRACSSSVPPSDNPGVILGTLLGIVGRDGRDKVTIAASPGIAGFGAWLEQLLAESTGKQGRGLIPVDGEPLGPPSLYGDDRIFVHLRLEQAPDRSQDAAVAALEQAGEPVVRISVADVYQLGQEFFRWEIATAVAGAILQINPFDQPDVEAAKVKAREFTQAYEREGSLPKLEPILEDEGVSLFADPRNAEELAKHARTRTLDAYIAAHLGQLGAGDYAAFLAYVERSPSHDGALTRLRTLVRNSYGVATCVGFGPRFQHSTGQVYKGGPNSGVFLQITQDDSTDLPVPGHAYGFSVVKEAQARGDFDVLAERGRRALRVHLGTDVAAGLKRLKQAIDHACASQPDAPASSTWEQ